MSILSAVVAPRRRAIGPALVETGSDRAEGITLADLTPGQAVRVLEVSSQDDPAAARRLSDLGFVPGAEVRMVRRAPLADPVVFRVAGYEIALRRAQARWVSVVALVS
ncbi:MAG: ferrous iron transport protein A [Nocardioidaceae bacterium]|nr:ferrous iron transport protein A [Nocardioidaceae bacterium]MCL2614284.1 ferrous iron transport protein A [Nocardioidaceae bacterium]